MNVKNLKVYLEKYKHIAFDAQERFFNYIDSKKFRNSDIENITRAIMHIKNIKRETLKIVFYIIPEATPRPRLSVKSGRFYVKNSKKNNDFVEAIINNEDDVLDLIKTPCSFTSRIYMPIPSNMSKNENILAELGLFSPVTTPDWDNLGKTYSDMIQKHILLTDSLITKGHVEKYYSLKPRVEIEIEYLLEFDSSFNRKVIENTKYYKELQKNNEEVSCNDDN